MDLDFVMIFGRRHSRHAPIYVNQIPRSSETKLIVRFIFAAKPRTSVSIFSLDGLSVE